MIEAIVFDVDDTLYDQQTPFENALKHVLPNVHAQLDVEQALYHYRNLSKTTKEKLAAGSTSREVLAQDRLNQVLHHQAVAPVSVDDALAFQSSYLDHLSDIKLFEGFDEMLTRLKQHYRVGIITNGQTEHQLDKLVTLNMHQWVDREHILTSEEAGIAKPDPRIFTMLNRKLDLKASEVAYVGDCYDLDIRAAKQAGWHAFWFNHRQIETPKNDVMPDQTVTTPEELQELLEALIQVKA